MEPEPGFAAPPQPEPAGKQAEQAPRRSEDQFATAFSAGPIILTITRVGDGRFVDVNESFLATTGYVRAEVLGHTPLELGLWVEPERRAEGLELLTQGRALREAEAQFRMKDGSVRTCLLSATALDVSGEPCVLTALTDITARKEAERVLERYQLLSERTRDIVLYFDVGGSIVEANAAAVAAYGYDHAALLTMRIEDLYGGVCQPMLAVQLELANQGGTLFEALHRRQDGTVFPVEVSLIGADLGGERVLLSIIRDITERQHAEADRARLISRQQLLAAAGEALTATLDMATTIRTMASLLIEDFADCCGLVLFESAVLPPHVLVAHQDRSTQAQLQGLLDQLLPGRAGIERALSVFIGEAPCGLATVPAGELTARLPMSQPTREIIGLLAPCSALIVRLLVQGQAIGALVLTRGHTRTPFDEADLGLAEDLARRCALALENARLYADEQRARAEAEAAVRLRDEFLSVASHELKTPLTALFGNAQIIQRRDAREGALNERDRRSLALIVEQAERLNRMMSELLDVTRIASGRIELNLAPLDLCELVGRVVDELRPGGRAHRLDLALPAEPVLMMGDELRLAQVVTNLLQNAVKYSPYGGTITVRLAPEDGTVTLTVADEGLGVPREALPRLFERYYRASNASAKRIAGMGIGLYVVKEIVELHAGSVAVASEEGRGSTFTVTLPL